VSAEPRPAWRSRLRALGDLGQALADPPGQAVFDSLIALPGLVRRVLRRGGVGGVLLTLGAREPRDDDPEERQPANAIGEMAVAGGVGPPRLRLLDGPGTSAAVVGTGPDDATIVVSRGMLDRLDQDEAQVIIGHLVASTGSGDLRIAQLILSLHATLGLLETGVFAAVSLEVRSRVREVFRTAVRNDPPGTMETEPLSLSLLTGIVHETMGDHLMEPDGRPTLGDRIRTVLVYPFLLIFMLIWIPHILLRVTVPWLPHL
jgi:hypothetical protein